MGDAALGSAHRIALASTFSSRPCHIFSSRSSFRPLQTKSVVCGLALRARGTFCGRGNSVPFPKARACFTSGRILRAASAPSKPLLQREFTMTVAGRTLSVDVGTLMLNFGAITSLSGFMMTDILYLRCLSIVGSFCGITYNMTRKPRQINAVMWGLVFMAVNMTMIIKLLIERREIHFTVDEAALYHKLFEEFGVSPRLFKNLMSKATWANVGEGELLIEAGKPLEDVILLATGSATAYDANEKALYCYSAADHGCIIGATAIVDPKKLGKPYPNNVIANTDKVKAVRWRTAYLREIIEKDHLIEAALMHTIYVDLIGALRRDRKEVGDGNGGYEKGLGLALHDLRIILDAACIDGEVSPQEKRMVRNFMQEHKITKGQFSALLKTMGWTLDDWHDGARHANENDTSKVEREETGERKTEESTGER